MSKQNRKHSKHIKNLIVIFSLTAVILSVSTYAWFIGMRTVNVSSFNVEISSTDSLLLSIDGSKWDTTVDISKANYSTAYTGNTNNWAGRGLIPVSSIGEMDSTVSRMKLFEKASLTASAGGYRLMASRVTNYENGDLEQDGYVVFDLFVKNFSGTQYLKNLEPNDEEAIYLTTDSAVNVDVSNGGVADTGIENSVRVAFAQIGRVAGTVNDQTTITGITCTDTDSVTGICRTAKIWEPNDTKHVANAINWYNTSCKARDVDGAYTSEACKSVIDGVAYHTYAIKSEITSANKVDVYDGEDYNKYSGSDSEAKGYLSAYKYFTDSDKIKTGTNRDAFMTLEPNSITKVRVYIYIEGQDIDNYDFASIGKTMAVKFGFTKERFTETDINYTDPSLSAGKDTTKPVITLTGGNDPVTLNVGTTYNELGATAVDVVDGKSTDLTSNIVISGTVDTANAGTYTVTYTVSDWAGNVATATRTVVVE